MTTYYIPVALHVSDDDYTGVPQTYMVDANSEEEAIEKFKHWYYQQEYKAELEYREEHIQKYGGKSYYKEAPIPTFEEWLTENEEAFWKDGEDQEEEGWVIGKITTELTHIT